MASTVTKSKKSRLFSEEQISFLKAYHENGLRGTGEQYKDLHERAVKETGPNVKQVLVSSNV